MRSKSLLCFALFALVLFVLVAPSLAVESGESCMDDDDCDGDMECIDGECAGGFTKFLHNSLGGWMGVFHLVLIFLILMGSSMAGLKAVFKDAGKWPVLIGIALALGGTIFIQQRGWIESLFTWGIGAYVIAIIIIVLITIMYFYLGKMKEKGAEYSEAAGKSDTAEGKRKRGKFAKKLKKGTKRSFRLSKELQDRVGDLANAVHAIIELIPRSGTPPLPEKVAEAKNKLQEAKDEYSEVIKLFKELDTLLVREAKWLRKGGLLRGDLAKSFKIGRHEYNDLNAMRAAFEQRVGHDLRELTADLNHSRFDDAAAGANAALDDIEDVEKGAKEVTKMLVKMRKLALEGSEEIEEEE